MKSNKIKLTSIILSILVVFCAFGSIMVSKQNNKVYAAEIIIENWEQKDGALLGDILSVPETVKLKIDDNTVVDADSGLIYFPDGNARTLGPKLLDIPGKYVLQYKATVGGKTYSAQQSFMVNESNYYVSNPYFSSANFVKAEDLKYGDRTSDGNKADGIEVSLARGDYFRFNQPINIFDVAKNNDGFVDVSMAFPVMDTSLVSDNVHKYDENGNPQSYWGDPLGSYFIIKLIDCYDESNFIEFYYWSNQNERLNIRDTQGGAGASNQQFSKLNSGTGASATVNIEGQTYVPVYCDRYIEGKPALIGRWLYGNTYTLFNREKSMFRLNVNTNEVYFDDILITDVDHPDIYPDNAFKGFTTGEVYVQYSFENSWTSQPMELYIKSILGLSGEQLQKAAVSDEKRPQVDIDVEYTDVANKSINVVYNKEFTLPKATVYDVNGKNDYKLAVYYDYYTDNPKSVYVNDGKFTPNKKGVVYTAVYSAVDDFGNANVDAAGKCLDVINIMPVLDNAFDYEQVKLDKLAGGTTNYLPAIGVTSKNNQPSTKVAVISPNGERNDITHTFDGENYSFIPKFIGEYTVEYTFNDNVYTEIFDYKVNCVDEGVVLFAEKIALPSVFIKDAIYDIETFYASVPTQNGLEKKEAKLLVSVDGGEFKQVENQKQFKVEGNSTLSFKAEYAGSQSAVQTCKITDVNYKGEKVYANYFVGADGVSATEDYTEYKFSGEQTELLQYATPLVFDTFAFEFEIPADGFSKMDSVSVILKEIAGVDNGYVITYAKTSSEKSLYCTVKSLDGKTSYAQTTITGSFGDGNIQKITVSNSTITLTNTQMSNTGALKVLVPALTAKNIEFSVQMSNVTEEVALRVHNLCGTEYTSEIFEKAAELVYQRPQGNPRVGVEFTLPTFNISSIFYPISLSNLKYTFKDMQGNVLVDKNGNKVEKVLGSAPAVTIIPTEVKLYFLTIEYDNFGESLFVRDLGNYIVTVMDTTAPVTKFDDGSNAETVVTVKVGASHKIKAFNVTDDVTASENLIVKVIIVDEDNAVVGWNVKDKFTFKKAGVYKVLVFAQDDNLNSSRTYYNVKVK